MSVSPDVLESQGTGIDMSLQIHNDLDWVSIQQNDSEIGPWIKYVKTGIKPKKGILPTSPLYRQFDHLILKDGILFREVKNDGDETMKQLVLPTTYVKTVLQSLHNEMGHPGRDRTNSLVRGRFYWPRMTSDIENWVQHCDHCLERKKESHRAPLVDIITTQPMELVCIDYLTLEPSKGGQHNILVITDHFTRYAQAIVTKNQTARTTADALFHNFIVHYGIPQKIHSDQGANFMSHLIKELCTLTGTKKSRTTPYHSMGNGMTERFNRTLLEMLGTLEPEKKKNWNAHVGPLVHAYNCIRHNSTNQSPYFLMFGRQPKLPIDLAFGLITEKERKPHTIYIQEIRERLVQAYKLASEASIKAQTKQKEGYDLRTRGAIIESGDRILVRIVAFDNKHKISDRWENDTYIVLKKPNLDIPVYTVQQENGQG
jgi:transposase InsO family protein